VSGDKVTRNQVIGMRDDIRERERGSGDREGHAFVRARHSEAYPVDVVPLRAMLTC
jgi:hypothetical protein